VNATIDQIKTEALRELGSATDLDAVGEIAVRYLGRKGRVTLYLRNISQLPVEQRPLAGKTANEVKNFLATEIEAATRRLRAEATQQVAEIDVSLPGRPCFSGALHPITQTTREICGIFNRLGFETVEGPQVETDYYNFEALNIPKNHPARKCRTRSTSLKMWCCAPTPPRSRCGSWRSSRRRCGSSPRARSTAATPT
jgi:phenylalanyl-tRNA synthetase alpha chain